MARKSHLTILALAGASWAQSSQACQVGPTESVIHSALPRHLQKELFVARVIIGPGNDEQLFRRGIRARVVEVVQGPAGIRHVLVRQSLWSSCGNAFFNGRKGLIVAVPRGREAGLLVVDPIVVTKSERFRLPDNFELSPSMRAGRIIIDQDALLSGSGDDK